MDKYLICEKCGMVDETIPGHVGTSKKMNCPDCGGVERITKNGILIGKPAKFCRRCCPTGHGTR